MPYIGERKIGTEIGRKNKGYHVWTPCPKCGKCRWMQGSQKNLNMAYCHSCYRKYQLQKFPAGEEHPHWKGGKTISDGYVHMKVSKDDFYYPMANYSGYVPEHRLIKAKEMGRCLLPWEVVHHRNGIRDDNRRINLELITDRRYHMIDASTKTYIKRLERENAKLRAQLA